MLDGEGLGEVRTGGLARAAPGVEVDVALRDDDGESCRGRDISVVLVGGEVGFRDPQTRLEQSFVDGAELADGQTAEIDRPECSVTVHVDQQPGQGWTDRVIREAEVVGGSARGILVRVSREESSVVGRYAPAAEVTGVDYAP